MRFGCRRGENGRREHSPNMQRGFELIPCVALKRDRTFLILCFVICSDVINLKQSTCETCVSKIESAQCTFTNSLLIIKILQRSWWGVNLCNAACVPGSLFINQTFPTTLIMRRRRCSCTGHIFPLPSREIYTPRLHASIFNPDNYVRYLEFWTRTQQFPW